MGFKVKRKSPTLSGQRIPKELKVLARERQKRLRMANKKISLQESYRQLVREFRRR